MNSPTTYATPRKFRTVRIVCMRDFVLPVVIQHDHFQPHERIDDANGSYESLRFALIVWFYPPANRAKAGPESLKGIFNYAAAARWIEDRKEAGMLVDQTMEDLLDEFLDAAMTYAQDVDLVRVQGVVYRGDLVEGEVCFAVERHYQPTDLELSIPIPSIKSIKPVVALVAGVDTEESVRS